MDKQEFLSQLRSGLSGLPRNDREERLSFYREMIEDRMEEGCSEEEAVSGIGPVQEVIAQIVAEIPLTRLVKEKIKPKHSLRVWEIVLLVLGSPLWLSLLVAALAVVLSFYVVIWSVILCLWAVEASLALSAVGGLVMGVVLACQGSGLTSLAVIGGGLVCAGLSIFLFFGCREVTRLLLLMTGKLILGVKNRVVKREEA